MSKAVIECCIALIPSRESLKLLDGLLVGSGGVPENSRQVLRLDSNNGDAKLATFAHLTLYQVALYASDLDKAIGALEEIVGSTIVSEERGSSSKEKRRRRSGPIDVSTAGSSIACSAAEGSCELKWHSGNVSDIVRLQQATVKELNKLRGELQITADPAGRNIRDMISSGNSNSNGDRNNASAFPGIDIDNLREYGFAEGITKFNPHVTLGWFNPDTTPFDDGKLQSSLSAQWNRNGSTIRFERLGVFALGPYGSCPQLLHSIAL